MLNSMLFRIKQMRLSYTRSTSQLIRSRYILIGCFLKCSSVHAQTNWKNVSNEFVNLPTSIKVLKSNDLLDGAPSIMYVATINAKEHAKQFLVDTSSRRRLTPSQYFTHNDQPLVVVN